MSGKLRIIDHATFERMQQSNSGMSSSVPRIRNSKYKRMSATNNFNILQFVKRKGFEKKSKIRKRFVGTHIVVIKDKGKKRKNGKIKKLSRLKKSILQYRQKKREQALVEKQLVESEIKLRNLRVDDGIENEKAFIPGIQSSSFREFSNCCNNTDLKKYCEQLIRELNHFQRRAYAQNAIKARAHKRFVVGFREVKAYLRINKIKLVIIATDCERNEGGDVSLDETIESIKTICSDQKIPIVFAFRRREMAYFLYKKASISCIGIIDYDGARNTFSELMIALKNESVLHK